MNERTSKRTNEEASKGQQGRRHVVAIHTLPLPPPPPPSSSDIIKSSPRRWRGRRLLVVSLWRRCCSQHASPEQADLSGRDSRPYRRAGARCSLDPFSSASHIRPLITIYRREEENGEERKGERAGKHGDRPLSFLCAAPGSSVSVIVDLTEWKHVYCDIAI